MIVPQQDIKKRVINRLIQAGVIKRTNPDQILVFKAIQVLIDMIRDEVSNYKVIYIDNFGTFTLKESIGYGKFIHDKDKPPAKKIGLLISFIPHYVLTRYFRDVLSRDELYKKIVENSIEYMKNNKKPAI